MNQDNNGGNADVSTSLWRRLPAALKAKLLLAGGGCLLAFLLVLIVFAPIYKMIGAVANIFFSDTGSSELVSDEELSKEESEFKEKVEDVAEKVGNKYDVKINKPLLVATVLYSKENDGAFDNEDEDEELSEDDIEEIEEEKVDKYKVSKRELTTLAKHMVDGKDAYREYLISTYIPNNLSPKDDAEKEKIADDIFDLADYYRYLFYDEEDDESSSNACGSYGDIKVNVTDYEDNTYKIIPFDEYMLGVMSIEERGVYANKGGNEGFKQAFIIAASSYALSLGKYEDGNSEIKIMSGTANQAWCDIYEGCHQKTSGPMMYDNYSVAPGPNSNGIYDGYNVGQNGTAPLTENQISNIKESYSQYAGKVVKRNGKIFFAQYNTSATHDGNHMNPITAEKQQMSYDKILHDWYNNITIEDFEGNSSTCTASGAWDSWKQVDPKWNAIPLGNSNVGAIGCLITSICKQIARSGVKTNVSGEFNPGTFVEALTKKGFIASNGALMSFDFGNIAPNFKYKDRERLCGLSKKGKADKVKKLLDKGYYVVMEVKGNHNTCGGSGQQGQHWVAVTGVNGSNISMSDTVGDDTRTDVWEKYGNNASEVVYFEKK